MKTLPVHVKGRLAILPWFFSEEWEPARNLAGGTCLPTHVLRIAEAMSGRSARLAWRALGKHRSPYGVTLEQTFTAVNERMQTELVALECNNVYDALDLLMQGIPSVLIVSGNVRIDYNYNTGICCEHSIARNARWPLSEAGARAFYHSFAVVGWDGGSKFNHLIVQENRSTYGFNGYCKLPVKALIQNPDIGKFIGITAR